MLQKYTIHPLSIAAYLRVIGGLEPSLVDSGQDVLQTLDKSRTI